MECKKVLAGILSCICAIFLMSYNANATDISVNARPTGAGITCMSWVNPVNVQAPTCNAIQNSNTDIVGTVEGINITINGTYYSDSVIELSFTFYRVSNTTSLHSIVNGVRQDNSVDTGWDLIGYDYSELDANTGKLTLLFKHRVNSGNFNARLRGNYGTLLFALQPSDRVVGANYTIYAINDANAGASQIVSAINSMPNYSNNLNTINNSINNLNSGISDVKDAINNQNEEEKQEVQDATDNAQSGADDAQAESEQATSSLLAVITGFFGAMANLDPTDCKFDSHLPFLSGNGQIDLCTVPAPAIVQTIGSLILMGLMVPFAIHMYNRFISITGSFQK